MEWRTGRDPPVTLQLLSRPWLGVSTPPPSSVTMCLGNCRGPGLIHSVKIDWLVCWRREVSRLSEVVGVLYSLHCSSFTISEQRKIIINFLFWLACHHLRSCRTCRTSNKCSNKYIVAQVSLLYNDDLPGVVSSVGPTPPPPPYCLLSTAAASLYRTVLLLVDQHQ